MKQKYYLLASFLGLMITTLVVSSLVSAAEDPSKTNDWQAGKNSAKVAFRQENQEQFAKMHELMRAGDFAAADTLRTELGLPLMPAGQPKFADEGQVAIKTAVDNNDYEAWSSLMLQEVERLKNLITEDNFAQMVKMHELRQAGDQEGAQAIAAELGLPKFEQFGRHHFSMLEKTQPAE